MQHGQRAGGQSAPGAEHGIGHGFLSPRRVDGRIHFGERGSHEERLFGQGAKIVNRGNADPLLLRSEHDGTDLHFYVGGIRCAPVDGHRTAQVDGNRLQRTALFVAQDEPATREFRTGEVGPGGAGVHFQKPGGHHLVALPKDEREAVDVLIRFRSHFPGGHPRGAT